MYFIKPKLRGMAHSPFLNFQVSYRTHLIYSEDWMKHFSVEMRWANIKTELVVTQVWFPIDGNAVWS